MLGVLIVLFTCVGLTACGLGLADTLGVEITGSLLWRIFFWCIVGLLGSLCTLWISEVLEIRLEIKRK